MLGLEVSCVAFPLAPPLLCVFAAFLCVKGLSTGNQLEVAPQLAVPDFISFCTSYAAPRKYNTRVRTKTASKESQLRDRIER